MQPKEIKEDLKSKGFSAKMLAEALDKTPASITAVINRTTNSRSIATAIAKVVGKPLTVVFDDVESYQRKTHQEKKEQLAKILAN